MWAHNTTLTESPSIWGFFLNWRRYDLSTCKLALFESFFAEMKSSLELVVDKVHPTMSCGRTGRVRASAIEAKDGTHSRPCSQNYLFLLYLWSLCIYLQRQLIVGSTYMSFSKSRTNGEDWFAAASLEMSTTNSSLLLRAFTCVELICLSTLLEALERLNTEFRWAQRTCLAP